MEVQSLQFNDAPETVVQRRFDCIWLNFCQFDGQSALTNGALQWIDWKMRGAVSRALTRSDLGELPLFLPTKGRLKTPYLALWNQPPALPESFRANCEGQNWKEILYFCVSEKQWDKVQKDIRKIDLNEVHIFLAKGFE